MASEYEQIKSAGIDPQVAELSEYHGLGGQDASEGVRVRTNSSGT